VAARSHPHRALTATITIAALTIVGDVTVIAIYLRSALPAQSVAAVAVAASLTRIACSLVTMRRAAAKPARRR
jgi:hypothetical protein